MEEEILKLESKLFQAWQEIELLQYQLNQVTSEKELKNFYIKEYEEQLRDIKLQFAKEKEYMESQIQAWMKVAIEAQVNQQSI